MNNEQMTQEQRTELIEKLHTEYNELNCKIARLNAFLNDIDFIKKVPDIIEQELMKGQLRAMENYLSNLRGRIMFQEARQKVEKSLDDWMNMKGKVVNTLCGPVNLINTDEQHHCGQDATCQVDDGSAAVQDPNESQPADMAPASLKELVGMQVQLVFPAGHKCDGCNNYTSCNRNWKKVELVGGYYLCLAPIPIVTE